jgi:hypothetical protein
MGKDDVDVKDEIVKAKESVTAIFKAAEMSICWMREKPAQCGLALRSLILACFNFDVVQGCFWLISLLLDHVFLVLH